VHLEAARLPGSGAARQRREDAGVQLLPMGEPRGLPGDAEDARDAGAEPGNQRAVPGVRAGDV